MVQHCIEPFEHRLRSQIHLVKENPVAVLHSLEEISLLPHKLTRVSTINRKVRTKQVCKVGLIREIDAAQMISADISQGSYETSLSYAGAPLEQNGL
jgi:hypothetical protein